MKSWWIHASRKLHKCLINLFENGGLEVGAGVETRSSLSHVWAAFNARYYPIIYWHGALSTASLECIFTAAQRALLSAVFLTHLAHEREKKPRFWHEDVSCFVLKMHVDSTNNTKYWMRSFFPLTWWIQDCQKQKRQESAGPAEPHVLKNNNKNK